MWRRASSTEQSLSKGRRGALYYCKGDRVLADENELSCDLITATCLQQSDWRAQIGAQGQVLYSSVTRLFRALSLPRATKRRGQTTLGHQTGCLNNVVINNEKLFELSLLLEI